ncbi:MAG: hypothetical protein SGI77_19540 [Pirellulaceae bacterium]|nr:hypothetical protein [Pirellulaceae bacterium]
MLRTGRERKTRRRAEERNESVAISSARLLQSVPSGQDDRLGRSRTEYSGDSADFWLLRQAIRNSWNTSPEAQRRILMAIGKALDRNDVPVRQVVRCVHTILGIDRERLSDAKRENLKAEIARREAEEKQSTAKDASKSKRVGS